MEFKIIILIIINYVNFFYGFKIALTQSSVSSAALTQSPKENNSGLFLFLLNL